MSRLSRLLSMSEKQAERWGRTRRKGAVFFVLVYGLLLFGGLTFSLSVCVAVFVSHHAFNAALLWDNAITWSLAGLAWGISIWYANEGQYRAAIRRNIE